MNFQSLFAHQAWADAGLLSAIHPHPPSLEDEWLQKTLRHMVGVPRYFLSLFLDRPFDREKEKLPLASFADLVARFRGTHEEVLVFVDGLGGADLDRRIELPFFKTEFALADMLTQVVMHGQSHRGQCLRYLRQLGAETPTLDYILWAKDRPAPAWPQI